MSGRLRELDLQIAERILRRDRLTARVDPTNRDGEPQYHWGYPTGHDFAPFYSADIAAAMIVVREMCVSGWSFACTIYQGKLPYASFCKGTAKSSRNAEAETLPEAICRAALQAIDQT